MLNRISSLILRHKTQLFKWRLFRTALQCERVKIMICLQTKVSRIFRFCKKTTWIWNLILYVYVKEHKECETPRLKWCFPEIFWSRRFIKQKCKCFHKQRACTTTISRDKQGIKPRRNKRSYFSGPLEIFARKWGQNSCIIEPSVLGLVMSDVGRLDLLTSYCWQPIGCLVL